MSLARAVDRARSEAVRSREVDPGVALRKRVVSSEEVCRWEGDGALTSSGEGGAREGEPLRELDEPDREGDSRFDAARRSIATACDLGVVASFCERFEDEDAERVIDEDDGSMATDGSCR